jgi:sugar phosphate isomerase/epimerase
VHGVGARPADDEARRLTGNGLLHPAKRLDHRKLAVEHHRRIGHINVHRRLRDTFSPAEAAENAAQVALDVVDVLARHGTNVEIETAIVRIARQPPRRTAANGSDGHVGALAHVFMFGFVITCPLRDVALQFVHHSNCIDHVRPIGER